MAAVLTGLTKTAPAAQLKPDPQAIPCYTYETLPDATLYPGRLVGVTNGNAGASCLAFSDGINWFPISIGTTACATS